MHKSYLESSATFILYSCELQKLWQGQENVQACLSLRHTPMKEDPTCRVLTNYSTTYV